MTIEIQRPELAALIQDRMASGAFDSIEEVLMEALRAYDPAVAAVAPANTLDAMFAKVRGFADDCDFSRNPSVSRDIAFE